MLEKTTESITTLFKQAQVYADNEEYDKADAILIKIITLQPQNSYEWEKRDLPSRCLTNHKNKSAL
ncbi:MAG: hypothetical protein ACFFAQ_03920 [Promethearchaeota archaeon]